MSTWIWKKDPWPISKSINILKKVGKGVFISSWILMRQIFLQKNPLSIMTSLNCKVIENLFSNMIHFKKLCYAMFHIIKYRVQLKFWWVWYSGWWGCFRTTAKRVLSAQCVLSSVCLCCVQLWHIIYGIFQALEQAGQSKWSVPAVEFLNEDECLFDIMCPKLA